MITVLDYGAGNVRSVINAIESLGHRVQIVSSARDIDSAEKLVFPGVGSFGSIMQILNEKQWVVPLKEYILADRPYLGICLGMQVLFESSEEAPGIKGLGIFAGRSKRFRILNAVPHIGWNGIRMKQPSRLFNGLASDESVYFVHSFYVAPKEESVILTTTDYEIEFVSAVQRGNIIGTQFHPEKSGRVGLRILENYLSSVSEPVQIPMQSSKTELTKRIVACLDVRANDRGDLVVTKGDRYDVWEKGDVRNLGKPVELSQRYYEEGADEIVFLNITGFRDFPLEDLPMIQVLKQTSQKVFVPLTIGGGIRDYTDKNETYYSAFDVAAEYFRSGADKISIGSDAVDMAEEYVKSGEKTGKSTIEQISRVYGAQAIVISIDPQRVYVPSPDSVPHYVIPTKLPGPKGEKYCWYQCTAKGGREERNLDAVTLAKACEELGAGEILLNCIDRDGTNSGFDLELINAVRNAVTIPIIASSGAGCVEHFSEVFSETKAESALAAGIFHRREVPIQAVKDHLKTKVPVRN